MLINLSNHPSTNWDNLQTSKALNHYSKIIDIEFPAINPNLGIEEVVILADSYAKRCMSLIKENNTQVNAVHVMGELTFCFTLVGILQTKGVVCVSSTSERKVLQRGIKKIAEFKFVQFRRYSIIS